MKRAVILSVLALVVVTVVAFTNDETGDEKRLEAFLSKVEKFYKNRGQRSANWKMPNSNPESADYSMPTGNINYVDPETNLEYNAQSGKIFDSQLNMELDIATGVIYDLKTRKEYSLADLRVEREQ
jgi:hypothetical protein